jgi:hypothetical protein
MGSWQGAWHAWVMSKAHSGPHATFSRHLCCKFAIPWQCNCFATRPIHAMYSGCRRRGQNSLQEYNIASYIVFLHLNSASMGGRLSLIQIVPTDPVQNGVGKLLHLSHQPFTSHNNQLPQQQSQHHVACNLHADCSRGMPYPLSHRRRQIKDQLTTSFQYRQQLQDVWQPCPSTRVALAAQHKTPRAVICRVTQTRCAMLHTAGEAVGRTTETRHHQPSWCSGTAQRMPLARCRTFASQQTNTLISLNNA